MTSYSYSIEDLINLARSDRIRPDWRESGRIENDAGLQSLEKTHCSFCWSNNVNRSNT